MIIKTKIVLLSLLSILLFTGVSHSEEPHYVNGLKYNDTEDNEKALKALKDNGIPIIVSDDGFITYPDSHKDQVDQILKKLDNRPHSIFYKKTYADNFAKLLEANNIKYNIKKYGDNNFHVYWDHKDDKLVRDLKNKNLNKIFNK